MVDLPARYRAYAIVKWSNKSDPFKPSLTPFLNNHAKPDGDDAGAVRAVRAALEEDRHQLGRRK